MLDKLLWIEPSSIVKLIIGSFHSGTFLRIFLIATLQIWEISIFISNK